MYKIMITACLAISVTGGASAAELFGAQIVAALSGNSYACVNKDKSKKMTMDFPKLARDAEELPYTYVYEGKAHNGAYLLLNDGKKLVSKSRKQKRRVMQLSPTTLQIIGRTGDFWVCTET